MFRGKMVTEAIPERVYALCKIVEKGPISSSDLKEKMEPDYLKQQSSYYNSYRKAAEELELITVSDNMISLAVEQEHIKTIQDMRQYINGILERFKGEQFYQVTKEFFDMDSDVLMGGKNIATWTSFSEDLKTDHMSLRAWRFWFSFLGFGFMHEMFPIPNASGFLWDIISHSKVERGKMIPFNDFIGNIRPECNIIISTEEKNKRISFGVSNGLRTLHDAGYIKMEHIMDQEDIWTLYPLKSHALSQSVTNIMICK